MDNLPDSCQEQNKYVSHLKLSNDKIRIASRHIAYISFEDSLVLCVM